MHSRRLFLGAASLLAASPLLGSNVYGCPRRRRRCKTQPQCHERGNRNYSIEHLTASEPSNAGTNEYIYVSFIDDGGQSRVNNRLLDTPDSDDRGRGTVDSYVINGPYVELNQVCFKMRQAGPDSSGKAWLCDYVLVTDLHDGREWYIDHFGWVDTLDVWVCRRVARIH